ncbi:hypothetical protein [Variovorax sp. V15]|uniref:hypothetical protein n=1 Tax=Variovorax sp. V15 TaxID=3065952 RepID=UPI0034E8E376
MDGVAHVHLGKTGEWVFYLLRMKPPEGGYSAVADIRLNGLQECKLVLAAPLMTQPEGDEALKRKCIDWIERREAEADAASQSAESEAG